MDTVNRPLGEIGVNYLGFSDLGDRVLPVAFDETTGLPEVYRKRGINASPSVGDWERVSGRFTIVNRGNGKSMVEVRLRKAFPNSVYTLWNIGTVNPLSDAESGYAMPLGGVPNVVTTDKNGCATIKINLSYNLANTCELGASFCSNYVSAFYNWDAQSLGASAGATSANAPTGIYGGNKMIWPTSGDLLIEPTNKFMPNRHGCRK